MNWCDVRKLIPQKIECPDFPTELAITIATKCVKRWTNKAAVRNDSELTNDAIQFSLAYMWEKWGDRDRTKADASSLDILATWGFLRFFREASNPQMLVYVPHLTKKKTKKGGFTPRVLFEPNFHGGHSENRDHRENLISLLAIAASHPELFAGKKGEVVKNCICDDLDFTEQGDRWGESHQTIAARIKQLAADIHHIYRKDKMCKDLQISK